MKDNSLSHARILFFIPEGDLDTNGIYASQVGGLAKYCAGIGAHVKIWSNKVRGHHWFFQTVRYIRGLVAANKNELESFRPTHIYVRNATMAIAARPLADSTGARLIYSMRGADVAETLRSINLRTIILAMNCAIQVRRSVRMSDHVNSVSRAMAQWIKCKYKCNTSVLPCCVPDYAFVDDGAIIPHQVKTVVYSGGVYTWQNIDSIIGWMQKIHKEDGNIKFRFLTKDIAVLKDRCAAHQFSEDLWTVKACTQAELPNELSKADVGIIIRDDTLINRVASPVKIGEYLAAGLGVIVSPCIGDIESNLSNKDFAFLIDDKRDTAKELADFINHISVEKRTRALHWARGYYTYEGNRTSVLEMFT